MVWQKSGKVKSKKNTTADIRFMMQS